MNYFSVLSLNIFSVLMSWTFPETFFQFTLLAVSIVLTVLKCLEMLINLKMKRRELKRLRSEDSDKKLNDISE